MCVCASYLGTRAASWQGGPVCQGRDAQARPVIYGCRPRQTFPQVDNKSDLNQLASIASLASRMLLGPDLRRDLVHRVHPCADVNVLLRGKERERDEPAFFGENVVGRGGTRLWMTHDEANVRVLRYDGGERAGTEGTHC